VPKYVVRHGVMRILGVFSTSRGETFGRTARVICRTARGLEAGEVLSEATPHAMNHMNNPGKGQILRRMTSQDELELRKLHDAEADKVRTTEQYISKLGLSMKLIDLEHLFGGERIIVYYLAEQRVDFRELVRQLAGEFQTRIEMRQIGVRDEAKLLADYGDCGKVVCCNTHLSEMPPVSMKMAKVQRSTLDPTKISGRCGRLKCCLRYEYETYQELRKELPPVGAEILTDKGQAKVLAQEVLAGELLIQTEDSRRITINTTDVVKVVSRGTRPKKRPRPDSGDRGETPKEEIPAAEAETTAQAGQTAARQVEEPDTADAAANSEQAPSQSAPSQSAQPKAAEPKPADLPQSPNDGRTSEVESAAAGEKTVDSSAVSGDNQGNELPEEQLPAPENQGDSGEQTGSEGQK